MISCLFAGSISLWIYYSFTGNDIWSISIYAGKNPLEFAPHPLVHKVPVLTSKDVMDVPATFVADPFMIYDNERWHMFFEVLNSSSNQGDIGYAWSTNGLDWQYEKIVLDEPFHISYPYVFKWNGFYYMIPESRKGSAVKLYKAAEFPFKWTFVRDLITGDYADSSIVYKDDKWWMFVLKNYDTLALFYADSLTGLWTEHPKSPLVKGNMDISRPGGRIIIADGKMIRYVQDCHPEYGNAVRIFQVDILTTTSYQDHEIMKNPLLEASGSGWNSMGMHHIDPHPLNEGDWIACVDGKKNKIVFDLKAGASRILLLVRSII